VASVDKRPDGQWRARWREYPGGPQKTKHFARKVDAEQYLVKVQHDLLTGSYIDPRKARTTVEEYYAIWEPRQPWRPTTRTAVRNSFLHALPVFGPRPLATVRRGDIESWAASLDLAASSVGLAVQHLGTMFEAAVADGLIAANPAHRAKRPKVEAAPIVPFTADELGRLHTAAPKWFQVALTLGAGCGLRQAEATGLTVDRVDFLRRELKVDRQLAGLDVDGVAIFAPPKTTRSYRTVPLAEVTVEALSAHIAAHRTGSDGVILHNHGRPLNRSRFSEAWQATRKRAGLSRAAAKTRYHDYADLRVMPTFGQLFLCDGVIALAVSA
jgi:integrase